MANPLPRRAAIGLAILLAGGLASDGTGSVAAQSSASLPRAPVTMDPPEARLIAGGLDVSMLGGLPSADPVPGSLPLSLVEALERGLRQNLALLLRSEAVAAAEGQRLDRRSDLLPTASARFAQRTQELNFEASPFSRFRPPDIEAQEAVARYETVDARLFISAALFDLPARYRHQAATARVRAEESSLAEMRSLVALLVGNLYLQTLTAGIRLESIAAQRVTSEALFDLTTAQRSSGLVSGVDVLRAEVRLEGDRLREIQARNEHRKAGLHLARAIGLPIGQQFHLTDSIRYVPLAEFTFEGALARAYAERFDVARADSRVEAARAEERAARSERLPTLELDADIGALGATTATMRSTFNAGAYLAIPLFDGGRLRAEVVEKRADVAAAVARQADLRALVYYQVQEAIYDLEAAESGVAAAMRIETLADRELTEARDRFAAGVASHLEVVAAQETVASAREATIDSLLGHRLAKGAIARAVGVDEQTVLEALAAESTAAGDPDPQ